MSVVINLVLILASILLIVVVLMQEGNKQGLGVIGGAAETFLGKNKAKSYEGKLLTITKILAAVFVVLAIAATWINARTYSVTYMVPVENEDGTVSNEVYYPYIASQVEMNNLFAASGMEGYTATTYAAQTAAMDAEALRSYAAATNYAKGDSITDYPTPAKEGYTGVWKTEDGKTLPEKMSRTSYVVYPEYTINQYTVTVKDMGMNGDAEDGVLFTMTADYGTEITYPENVKLPEQVEGYQITWSGTLPPTIPGADTEISVVYTEGNYVTYMVDGEEYFPAAWNTYNYIAYLNWYTAMMNGDTESANAMDLDALTKEAYDAAVAAAKESGKEADLRYFAAKNEAPIAYSVPAKEGYTGAWDITLPETMDGAAYTLTAVYTAEATEEAVEATETAEESTEAAAETTEAVEATDAPAAEATETPAE